MDTVNLAAIADFYNHLDVFALIVVRLIGFMVIMPIFAGANIPNLVKIGLAVAVGLLVYQSGVAGSVTYDDSIPGYVLLIFKEFMVGFCIGFAVYIVFNVVFYAGQLIDFQIGFSMVSVLDPLTQIQVPITGNLLYLVVTVIFVVSGGFSSVVAAVFYSFQHVPIGTADVIANGGLVWYLIQMIATFFVTGLKIAMPIVGSVLILDVSLGILVKTVPQMNVFVVGMPIKLLAGIAMLVIIAPMMATVYNFLYDQAYNSVLTIIKGLSP